MSSFVSNVSTSHTILNSDVFFSEQTSELRKNKIFDTCLYTFLVYRQKPIIFCFQHSTKYTMLIEYGDKLQSLYYHKII